MNSYQNFEMNTFNPMYIENETLKKRLDYLETVISSAERFESTRTIVDLKSFINDVLFFCYYNNIFLKVI